MAAAGAAAAAASGAAPQPAGSLTGSGASAFSSIAAAPAPAANGAVSGAPSAVSAVSASSLSRLKNAVTSPPVGTIATTVHPSDDFSLSLVASPAGSYEDELTVTYSCMEWNCSHRDGPCAALPAKTAARGAVATRWGRRGP